MTIRLASQKDSEHIFKIWHACFTDDQAYIMNYLKYCLPHTKTWVLGIENGEFVSCLSIIPSYFVFKSKIIRGGYLYAVGTLPEHRGNSYSKLLMESAINDCRKDGMSYLLVKPATDSLYSLYRRASFDKVLYKSTSVFFVKEHERAPVNITSLSSIEASDLYTLREDSLANKCFLWPEKILEYAIIEALSRSGSCKKFEISVNKTSDLIYYIAYPAEQNKKTIQVLETNARSSLEIECLISVIKSEYKKIEKIEIVSSCDFPSKNNKSVSQSALLLPFDKELSTYMENLHLSLPLE